MHQHDGALVRPDSPRSATTQLTRTTVEKEQSVSHLVVKKAVALHEQPLEKTGAVGLKSNGVEGRVEIEAGVSAKVQGEAVGVFSLGRRETPLEMRQPKRQKADD